MNLRQHDVVLHRGVTGVVCSVSDRWAYVLFAGCRLSEPCEFSELKLKHKVEEHAEEHTSDRR